MVHLRLALLIGVLWTALIKGYAFIIRIQAGLLIYEFGFSYDFKDMIPVAIESEFVLGGANTGDLFNGDGYFYSLIGWEADIHNKIKITEDLEFGLSLSYLLAGNSFNAVYELNNDDEILELADSSFKVDYQLKYSF